MADAQIKTERFLDVDRIGTDVLTLELLITNRKRFLFQNGFFQRSSLEFSKVRNCSSKKKARGVELTPANLFSIKKFAKSLNKPRGLLNFSFFATKNCSTNP